MLKKVLNQKTKILKACFRIVPWLALIYAIHAVPASAQQTSIDRGVTWLLSVQQADGSWSNEPRKMLDTHTVLETLILLKAQNVQISLGLMFVSGQVHENTNNLSQQLEVLAASGADVSSLIASIKSAQHPDGGWGLDLEKHYTSDVVDTMSALRALKVAGATDVTIDSNALSYLLTTQNADGGFGFYAGDVSNLYMTALVSATVQQFTQIPSLASALNKATAFLIAHQNADGGFGASLSITPPTPLNLRGESTPLKLRGARGVKDTTASLVIAKGGGKFNKAKFCDTLVLLMTNCGGVDASIV